MANTTEYLLRDAFDRFSSIQMWRRDNTRAPHKPLLLLLAIGRCLEGKPRLFTYESIEPELSTLLSKYGLPINRRYANTQEPFWRLANDNVWEIDRPHLVRTTSKNSPFIQDLRQYEIKGGLKNSDYSLFQQKPELALSIAFSLVKSHYPPSLQEEVLQSTMGNTAFHYTGDILTGNDWVLSRQRRRDPTFRPRVLSAYGSRCALCEYSGELYGKPIAIEAAHIMWHEANGPAIIQNGIALCSLHHKLFDSGVFTLESNLEVVVSEPFQGNGVDAALRRFHGTKLRAPPKETDLIPSAEYLEWHRTQVFISQV